MNESTGGALLTSIVITIVGIIIVLFTASFAYNKAHKAQSIVLNAIQDNGEYDPSLNASIEEQLTNLGYNQSIKTCANKNKRPISTLKYAGNGYCVYEIVENVSYYSDGVDKFTYKYYEIETYLQFQTPLFSFNIPIYGQGKPYRADYIDAVDYDDADDLED